MKIYITGISGTGKTSIAKELEAKGFFAISVDEIPGLCHWRHKENKEPAGFDSELTKEFIEAHEWVCDAERLKELMGDKENVFVLGITSNQNEYLNFFDKILLLQCSPEVFIQRINSRENNDFGKDEGAQETILGWYKDFEKKMLEIGAVPVSVDRHLDEVVAEVISHNS